MKTINKKSKITIYWKIWRGVNKVTENFSSLSTNLKVFLMGHDDVLVLNPSVNKDVDPGYEVLEMTISAGTLGVGAYGIKAVWTKNEGRDLLTSMRSGVFGITDSDAEASVADEEIRLVSSVESYGRDGMSAFETAVMRNLNNGIPSEVEWVGNEAKRIADETARDVAEKAREEAEIAREGAEAKRVDTFNANEETRQTTFETNETNRGATFASNETNRENAYLSSEQDREVRFATAEENRNKGEAIRQAAFEGGENNRATTFTRNEESRQRRFEDEVEQRAEAFNAYESSRQRAFEQAERDRGLLFSSKEDAREADELKRDQAEAIRNAQESVRQQAEQIRIDTFDENERGRIAAENERKQNETQREANEAIRQESYKDKLPVSAVVQETGDGENVVMSQKAVSGKLAELESELSYIYFSDRNKPGIVTNAPGSQYASFTITMPNAMLRAFIDGNNRIVNKAVTSTDVFTIKEAQGLYYNRGSLTFSVKTIGSEAIESNELFLFGNSAGVAFGPLSKYYYDAYAYEAFVCNNNQTQMLKGLHSFWYFTDRSKPTIVTNAPGSQYASFTITMPNAMLRAFYNDSERIVNKAVTSSEIYTISEAKGLFYNLTSQTFAVKAVSSESISVDDVLLFGVNSGVLFGLLSHYYYDAYAYEILKGQNEIRPYNNLIPAYFNEQLSEVQDRILYDRSLIGKNGEQFIFISDLHWASNMKNSPSLINSILKNTPISKVFLNGDYISAYDTKDKAKRSLNSCITEYKNLRGDIFFLYGNHDRNTNQSNTNAFLAEAETYNILQSQMRGIVYGDYFYFYHDNAVSKTRFICLSTGPIEGAESETGIPTKEYTWLSEVLNNTPNDYHCIIFIHAVKADADGDYTPSADQLFTMLDNNNNADNGCKVEAIFSGHTHKDFNGITPGGIPVIITDTDGTGSVGTSVEVGTITEQCFDVVTIDYINKVIYCDRIGRGQSRVINY